MKRITSLGLVAFVAIISVLWLSTSEVDAHDTRMPLVFQSVLPTPTPTPIPSVHTLANDTAYESTTGSIWIVGEVENTTATNVSSVRVSANLRDDQGRLVASSYGYIDLEALHPGDKTCYVVLFYDPPSNAATYEIEGVTYRSNADAISGLAIIEHNAFFDSDLYTVVGRIKNNGSSVARYVSAVATLYRHDSKVLACHSSFVNSTDLNPGQISSFELDFYGFEDSDVANYRLQATGLK